ncbi:MAG: hypothetical protein WBM47_05045, partial [Polyangiales bacterium]
VIRQTWQKHKQTFLLTTESVESGHPGLLMVPEAAQPTRAQANSEPSQGAAEDAEWSSVY